MKMLFESMFCYIKNKKKRNYAAFILLLAAVHFYLWLHNTSFMLIQPEQAEQLYSYEFCYGFESVCALNLPLHRSYCCLWVCVRTLILLCACPPQPASSETKSETTEKNCFVSKGQAFLELCFSPNIQVLSGSPEEDITQQLLSSCMQSLTLLILILENRDVSSWSEIFLKNTEGWAKLSFM